MPIGGDFGAHVWAPAYLRDHIPPHWRLSGWAPDWYAGFPHVQVLHGGARPAHGAARHGGALRRRPQDGERWASWPSRCAAGRSAASLVSRSRSRRSSRPPVFFLFDWSFTIYGGNVASTMAGEFSFSIALALRCCIWVCWPRHAGRARAALAALLFARTVLCHLIVGIFAVVRDRAHVPALGRSQAHPLRAHHGAGGRAAHRVLDAALPVRRRLHDRQDVRATAGRQRAQRPARLVLADAVPLRGVDRHPGLRACRHRPDRLCDPRATGRRLPRPRRGRVRRVGVHLAAEPPVERPPPAVHVPRPVPAGLHRRLRTRGPRRPPPPARVP